MKHMETSDEEIIRGEGEEDDGMRGGEERKRGDEGGEVELKSSWKSISPLLLLSLP